MSRSIFPIEACLQKHLRHITFRNMPVSLISYLLFLISYLLSLISHLLFLISYLLSLTSHLLSTISYLPLTIEACLQKHFRPITYRNMPVAAVGLSSSYLCQCNPTTSTKIVLLLIPTRSTSILLLLIIHRQWPRWDWLVDVVGSIVVVYWLAPLREQ